MKTLKEKIESILKHHIYRRTIEEFDIANSMDNLRVKGILEATQALNELFRQELNEALEGSLLGEISFKDKGENDPHYYLVYEAARRKQLDNISKIKEKYGIK